MISTVDLACTACGSTDDEVLYEGREHEYADTTDELFRVVRCRSCSLVRLNPRPDVSELGTIYPPEYYAYHLVDANEPGRFSPGNAIKKRFYQRSLAATLSRIDLPDPLRLLDVGCADGRILDWYRLAAPKLGRTIETHGIEMSEEAASIAGGRGHDVVAGRFEVADDRLPRDHFHMITARHVIEHVDDPRRFCSRAFELLAPGGVFVVATPNVDSWDARRYREHWGGNHFPRHWTLFDAETLGAMARSVGLEPVHVEYELNPVFWNWTFHAKSRHRSPDARWPDAVFPPVEIFNPSPRSFALLSLFTTVDIIQKLVTGRTASMIVELRKPSASDDRAGAVQGPS